MIDRIEDELLDVTYSVHPEGGRFLDKRDIPSEVSRVLDLLDTLFRRARRDQKCPVTAEPAAIRRESDRHVFVVMADWAEGSYRITGQALALIEEAGPDARTRDRIVEALRHQWDGGVDRPVVDSELVGSCSRALESG